MSDDSDGEGYEVLRQEVARLVPLQEAVLAIVDFVLPTATEERFLRVGQAILANPPVIARLTAEGGSRRDWSRPFMNSAVGDVREGLSASYYHLGNVETLETEVVQRAAAEIGKLDPPERPMVTGVGTRLLNYEYQAFRFALRRTLDYLAVAVAAFFKCKPASINDLSKALKNTNEGVLRDRVCARVESALSDLSNVIEKPNVRDQIAHWEAVEAGALNILWDREMTLVSLAAGGEKLTPWEFSSKTPPRKYGAAIGFLRLTPRLRDQLDRVEALIFDAYADLGLLS